VENLENRGAKVSPGKLGEIVEEMNDNLKDSMNLSKHRASYQDALAQIHENVNLTMLQTLSESKNTVPDDEHLDKIQKLRQYKDTVSELEDFLDGVKT